MIKTNRPVYQRILNTVQAVASRYASRTGKDPAKAVNAALAVIMARPVRSMRNQVTVRRVATRAIRAFAG